MQRETLAGQQTIACQVCSKNFISNVLFKKHVQKCLKKKTFTCEICNRIFVSKVLLNKHVQKCLKKTTFTCEICNRNYASKKNFNKHIQQQHTEITFERFVCGVCYKNYKSNETLDKHIFKCHSEIKTFMCEICKKSFSSESLFLKHLKYHSEKPHVCEKCHYRFADETKLREHLDRHSEDFLHECELCNRKCKTKQDLMLHKYSHEGKRKVFVKAETDSVTYSQFMRKNANTYVKRSKNAPNEYPYVCEICNSGFKTNADLMIHKHIHNQNRIKSEM